MFFRVRRVLSSRFSAQDLSPICLTQHGKRQRHDLNRLPSWAPDTDTAARQEIKLYFLLVSNQPRINRLTCHDGQNIGSYRRQISSRQGFKKGGCKLRGAMPCKAVDVLWLVKYTEH